MRLLAATRNRLLRAAVGGALVLAPGVLVGCGTDPEVPAQTVRIFYAHLGAGDFAGGCGLLDDELRTTLTEAGQSSCEDLLRELSGGGDRSGMTSTEVDASKVQVSGGTATVPEEAIRFGGRPSDGGDLALVRRDDRWLISDID